MVESLVVEEGKGRREKAVRSSKGIMNTKPVCLNDW